MTLDLLSQIVIAVFGGVGFLLVAKKNRWGFVCVLITEPFWFYSTYASKQWGAFLVTFMYTLSCLIGIDEWFFGGYTWQFLKAKLWKSV